MRALLIDDNPDDRALARRALAEAFPGAALREVGTAEELEQALAEEGYQLAVTDFALRWSNGLEVLDRLLARYPRLPVIMFTSSGNEEVCAEAMKRGLADYVIKAHGKYQRLAHAARGALERQALRSRAEEASRLKEEFLATLSHELRTPLHSVLGWTQLLKQGSLKGEDQRHALEVIERNARAQALLIEDVLDLSRLETGRLKLDADEIDLAPVLLAAVAAVEPMAQANGVTVRPSVHPEVGTVLADPARVRQMVLNLLTNAIKFSPRGGEVQARLAAGQGHALIEVVDRGIGIPAQFLPHVFDRFRQADATSTRRSGGLGIGLALVKRLAEAHGGEVGAHSAGQGQGATFTLRLPLAAKPRPGGRALPDRENPPSLQGVCVVAIDDDPDSLGFLQRTLAHCAADVAAASGAEEGLRLVRERRPQVVVCDIGMPGVDGYGFVERLRCMPEEGLRGTPAIALTAFARSEDRERALLAGFDSYVAKPVDGFELIVVVAGQAGVLERDRRCPFPG